VKGSCPIWYETSDHTVNQASQQPPFALGSVHSGSHHSACSHGNCRGHGIIILSPPPLVIRLMSQLRIYIMVTVRYHRHALYIMVTVRYHFHALFFTHVCSPSQAWSWIFSIDLILPASLWSWVSHPSTEMSPGIFQGIKGTRSQRKADNLTTVGTSTSHNPTGLHCLLQG
jgi:hypothetical protein